MTTQEQRDAEYRAALGLGEGEPLPSVLGTAGGSGNRSKQRRAAWHVGHGAKVVGAGDAMSLYKDDEDDRG